MKRFFLLLIVSTLLYSCARVGSPVGGTKDSLAPVMTGSNIDTPRVNVPQNLKELRLDFNEYVALNQVTKNLIISPPIKRIKRILPSSLANRYILIQWEDTLQANTTYNFNFGNAIKDNNEGNVLPYFNFAFSTGSKIDDIYISGEVKNRLASTSSAAPSASKSSSSGSGSNEKSLVVGLYKASDSINYKEKPYYITVADTDGYYELNYLSPGTYRVLAFEDLNSNSIFDTGTENVGFMKDSIVLDKSISGLNIDLFPTRLPQKYLEIKENPGGLLMLFQGNPDKTDVLSLNENIKDYKVSHKQKSDSVLIWFDAKKDNVGIDKSEQLRFSYDTGLKQDTISIFYRMNAKNEMQLTNTKGNLLAPKKSFEITSNYILDKINTEKWTVVSDSVAQPFTARISESNPYTIYIDSEFKEGKKYSLNVPKETVFSYFDQNLKAYRFDFEADKSENYGSVLFKLENAPRQKFWFQLINAKNEAVYSKYTLETEIKFDVVKPDTYSVRILVDNNENGFWDPADFENQIFAEDVYDLDKKITARPLWDIRENWDLKAKPKEKNIPVTNQNNEPAKKSELQNLVEETSGAEADGQKPKE